jgi:hypothetical protein
MHPCPKQSIASARLSGCHDWHVRQYGQDLELRFENVAFGVRLIDWLCKHPREKLLSLGALPMRLYQATKAARA